MGRWGVWIRRIILVIVFFYLLKELEDSTVITLFDSIVEYKHHQMVASVIT
jgi:hypothetical protein